MKNRKLLLIIVLLLVAIVSISTYAIYKSSSTGTVTLETANWKIKLNNQDITTNNTFTYNLKDADWTHGTNIDSDEQDYVVIAPGSYGTFNLTIDATETEVDVQYEITAVVKQNGESVLLSRINPNLTIGYYNNGTFIDNKMIIGEMPALSTHSLELRVLWDEVDSNNSNNQDININDQDFVIEVTVVTKQDIAIPVCVRVTDPNELHSEVCNYNNGSFCDKYDGYGSTITFGQAADEGSPLVAGDAFDCDVNGDGNYNERFYYVSDYFDTNASADSENVFDDEYAVLIYYTNYNTNLNPKQTTEASLYTSRSTVQQYYPGVVETHEYLSYGPMDSAPILPSSEEWKNVNLKVTKRQMLLDNNSVHNSTTLYESTNTKLKKYDYEGRAARLLTAQELRRGCNLDRMGTNGQLVNCKFLLENTKYTDGQVPNYGMWLETFAFDTLIALIDPTSLAYGSIPVSGWGTRPAIEVPYKLLKY